MCREALPPSVDKLVMQASALLARAKQGRFGGLAQKALVAQAKSKAREAVAREPENTFAANSLGNVLLQAAEICPDETHFILYLI